MRAIKLMILAPAVVLAAACGRNSSSKDDALKNDLALASQAQPYNPQQVLGPNEMGYENQYAPQNLQTVARQPVVAQPVRRTTSTARRSSSGSRSSGRYYPAPTRTETVKHTKRDAAIGAASGAVIGAIASRDKVKGGIIGAAVGGILGGVIGNNVDVQRRQVP